MRRLVLACVPLLAGCALSSSVAIPSTQQLAGVWHGRVSGFVGHAMAVMTVADTGVLMVTAISLFGTVTLDRQALDAVVTLATPVSSG